LDAHKALMNIAITRPCRLNFEQVSAIHAVYLLDQIVRLLGEGYDIGHDMVAWYGQVLAKIEAPKHDEAVIAGPSPRPSQRRRRNPPARLRASRSRRSTAKRAIQACTRTRGSWRVVCATRA